MADLTVLGNIASSVTFGGKEFKVSKPSLKDIAEAQQFAKSQKQEHRKEYIKQYTELLAMLPTTMSMEEKKQTILSILPAELTPIDKIKLIADMPESWNEEQKNRQLNRIVLEREGVEWDESLYLVYKCLEKHQKVTFDEVKSLISVNDLETVVKIVSPSKEKGKEKNV